MVITIIIAINTDDGLVVDDYYKHGLEINRTLERDRKAEGLNLQAVIQHGKDSPMSRILLDAGDDFIYPDTLTVSFLNASRDGLDQVLEFKKNGEASYVASSPDLPRGKWHILIEHDDWRLLQVLRIP